jgi:glycosyltransferase involved in cell wall biosynthesis
MMQANVAPVSVVIPCYRCSATIGRAIESIVRQTQNPAEIILVDDASEDGTWSVLQEIKRIYPDWVTVLQLNKNQGAASARNAGWNAANQPYLAFLDADDAWHPKKIEIQYAYMALHSEVLLSGHHYRVIKKFENLPDWQIGLWSDNLLSKRTMLISNRFTTPSVMLRRDVPDRFLSGKRHVDDHLLWLELICKGHKMVKLSAELVSIYKPLYGSSGLSAQLWLMEKGELETYKRLYDQTFINFIQWLGLSVFSLLKFVRRLLAYALCLRWRK